MHLPSAANAHRLARSAALFLLAACALLGCASGGPPSRAAPSAEQRMDRLDKDAMHVAVADGLTTGLVALTGAKIGLVKFAERLQEDEKRLFIKSSGSAWTGAAVNKLMVLLATPTPVAIAAGVVAGVLWWRHGARVYERADRKIAAREEGLDGERREVAAAAPAP